MIDGFDNPYRIHTQYGGYTVVLTQEFVAHCIDAVKAVGGTSLGDTRGAGELKLALKAVETAFLRGISGYDPKSAKAVARELLEQDERLQRHMYFKYIRKNDANKARYEVDPINRTGG